MTDSERLSHYLSQTCFCCFPLGGLSGLRGASDQTSAPYPPQDDGAGGGGQVQWGKLPLRVGGCLVPGWCVGVRCGWQAEAGSPDALLPHSLLGRALVHRAVRLGGVRSPGVAGWCKHWLLASRSVLGPSVAGEGQRTGSGGCWESGADAEQVFKAGGMSVFSI